MIEQWRDVVGYEGYYQVSNLGRVKSLTRVVRHPNGGLRRLKSRYLQLTPNARGYLRVGLSKSGIVRTLEIHRVVAGAFLGPCPENQQVRHGPNGKLDNSVSNLCYGTKSEDALDRRRDGTHGGHPVRRSDGIEFINVSIAAIETGCHRQNINAVCQRRRNFAGEYGWEYI